MIARWVTAAYLAYLAAPIVLLFVGSFGDLWLNTLLPTGVTLQVVSRTSRPTRSFRRAFGASLSSRARPAPPASPSACRSRTRCSAPQRRGCARSRASSTSCRSRCPPLVLAFGFILVFSSDTLPWLGSIWLLVAGHLVLGLPYFLQTVIADMQRLGLRSSRTRPSRSAARPGNASSHIVLPALRHSILSGSSSSRRCRSASSSSRTWSSGFLNRTYPVVLLQAFYGATGFACAATVDPPGAGADGVGDGALSARGAARCRRPRVHA